MSESTATATPIAKARKGERQKQIAAMWNQGMRPIEIAKELGLSYSYVGNLVRYARLRGGETNRPPVAKSPLVAAFISLVKAMGDGDLAAAVEKQSKLRELGWDVRPVARQHMNATTTNA